MARGRMLANTLSTSEKFNALYRLYPLPEAEFAQLTYTMMMTHVDDCGRFPGDACTVKYKVLPLNPRELLDFDRALEALHQVALIHRYAIGGKQFLSITDFPKYQALRHPLQSTLPAPPGCPPVSPRLPTPREACPPVPPSVPGIVRDTQGHTPPKEVKEVKEVKNDPARLRARRPMTSVDYLADCTHAPACETPHLCGERRRIEAAVRDKVLALEQAERLVRLLIADRQPIRARGVRTDQEGSS